MDILRAYKIACQLHAGQTDKAGRPYIEHLTRVMLTVQMDDELLHPMRCKGWSFTGRMSPRLGQFLTGY